VIVRRTRSSNPHRFFTFQNFEGIIEYAKNEFNYTKRIVCGGVFGRGSVYGIGLGIVSGIGLGIVRRTRNSNPREFFIFQNFEDIILYATNEFD
jgi:hypothetical protein